MPNKFFNGIGSLWSQLFEDRKTLESFGYAAKEILTSAYMQLSNTVLSINHDDIPVFDRTKWDIVVLKASEVITEGGQFKFPIPSSLNNKGLRSASLLLPSLVFPKLILAQNQDFTIEDEFIVFNSDPFTDPDIPVITVSGGDQEISLWAPGSEVDTNRLWRYYGHFTKRWRYSSQDYKHFIRGMFHAWMFGPNVNRIESGLQLIAGLPLADGRDETVLDMITQEGRRIIRTSLVDYDIVPEIGVNVNIGDALKPFQVITDAIQVVDYLIEPFWWRGNVNELPADIGTTNDVDKAFDQYLKYNTFLVKINLAPFLKNASALVEDGIFNPNRLIEFISEFKASYTYAFPLFYLRFVENIAPKVSVTISRESYALEDRRFGRSFYYNLSSGKDLSSGIDLQSIGVIPGISVVNVRMEGNLDSQELYPQIPFVYCGFDELINLDMGYDLSDGIALDTIINRFKWCSPIERRSYNLSDEKTLDSGLSLDLLARRFRPYDLSMDKTLDDGLTLGPIAMQGFVEEVDIEEHADIIEDISAILTETVNTYEQASGLFIDAVVPAGVVDGSNKTFTVPDTPYGSSFEFVQAGKLLEPDTAYVIAAATITFTVAPTASNFLAFYRKDDSGSTIFVENTVPTGTIDGVNRDFTLAHSDVIPGSLRVYVNGDLYTLDDMQLTLPDFKLDTAPPVSAWMLAFYRRYTRVQFIDNAILTGVVDGVNTEFILPSTPISGSLNLYTDRERQTKDTDFSLSGADVSFVSAPTDQPRAFYRI